MNVNSHLASCAEAERDDRGVSRGVSLPGSSRSAMRHISGASLLSHLPSEGRLGFLISQRVSKLVKTPQTSAERVDAS